MHELLNNAVSFRSVQPYLADYVAYTFAVSEGKRASGLTAVWVARNRFAVLDRTHNVRFTRTNFN